MSNYTNSVVGRVSTDDDFIFLIWTITCLEYTFSGSY